ncbi:hypothetical protein GGR56DRAFT_637247 [Xylariaceae sp. FL0804]|nr:hypothetical protein GGR56DRAFT_637247 [Xylariaceae sp. FL0804]
MDGWWGWGKRVSDGLGWTDGRMVGWIGNIGLGWLKGRLWGFFFSSCFFFLFFFARNPFFRTSLSLSLEDRDFEGWLRKGLMRSMVDCFLDSQRKRDGLCMGTDRRLSTIWDEMRAKKNARTEYGEDTKGTECVLTRLCASLRERRKEKITAHDSD